MSRPKVAAFLAASVLVAAVVGTAWLVAFRDKSHEFSAGIYDPPQPAYPLDLIDQDGDPFSLESFEGDVVLLYFGYTFCPSFCPTTMADMQQVKAELGEDAENVAVVMVTVDPARDTPERLRQWLYFFDRTFIGLTGTDAQLATVEQHYGVTVSVGTPEPGDDYYLVDHSTLLYAIDPAGNLRLSWPYGADPKDIAADVRHLLHS